MTRKPRTQPQQRQPSELRDDSKTLRYELEMLIRLARGYPSPDIQNNRISRNAYIESFAVHCRALIFFLFGHEESMTVNSQTERFGGLRPDDVIAFDFHPGWLRDCPQPTAVMLEAKQQADKHVAHVTTDRRNLNQPGKKKSEWDLEAVTSQICREFDIFLTKAGTANATSFDPTALGDLKKLIADRTSFASSKGTVSAQGTVSARGTTTSPSITGKTQSGSK
jgi:hypothetical protein